MQRSIIIQGPDDNAVFAAVSIAIMKRYTKQKGYVRQTDYGLWNEATSEIEDRDISPFWCKSAAEYAELYATLWTAAHAAFDGDEILKTIRIGITLGVREPARGH